MDSLFNQSGNGVTNQASRQGSLGSCRLAEVIMSDSTANQVPSVPVPTTITEITRDLEPMGDPSQFAIGDLTLEEEDAFFAIIEDL